MSNTNKKDHADFQDAYRKSSNFGKTDSGENLKPSGNGKVKLVSEEKEMTETDKKKIADAMDSFQQRIEMTPGGEQSDSMEEE